MNTLPNRGLGDVASASLEEHATEHGTRGTVYAKDVLEQTPGASASLMTVYRVMVCILVCLGIQGRLRPRATTHATLANGD